VSRLNAGLTLPLVPPEQAQRALWLKNLYALWNFVLDDEIDRDGTRANLDASIRALLGGGPAPDDAKQDAAKLMDRMLSEVPTGKPREAAALHLDLWELINGLNYEHCINRFPSLANSL
jgi:hypothetical protein